MQSGEIFELSSAHTEVEVKQGEMLTSGFIAHVQSFMQYIQCHMFVLLLEILLFTMPPKGGAKVLSGGPKHRRLGCTLQGKCVC